MVQVLVPLKVYIRRSLSFCSGTLEYSERNIFLPTFAPEPALPDGLYYGHILA